MRKKGWVIFVILLSIFAINFVYSAAVEDNLHLNIQTINSSGDIISGTFNFVFNISTSSNCANVVYTNSSTLTTDSRGIISYYLENTGLNYSEQYWLCYYRDGVLVNSSKIARSPYAFSSRNVSLSGIIADSNLNLENYNVTTTGTGFFFWLGSLVSRINSLFVQNINFNGTITGTGNISTLGNISGEYFFGNGQYLTGISLNSSYNATYDSYALNVSRNWTLDTYNNWNAAWLSTYNVTYANYISGNSSFNQSLTDTLYAPIGSTSGNSSWNQSYANILYAPNTTAGIQYLINGSNMNFGSVDFNGGFSSGNGVSILGGDVWAKTLYVYNISSVNVNNININGSLFPRFNDMFDLGNSTFQWKNAYFSGTVYINNGTDISTLGNSSFNQSLTDTLYAPIGSTSGNSTWNESRANALYYGISNPSGFFNVSSYQSYNSTYHNYPVIWNSSILQYLNSGTNASYLSTYNSTYAALVTDNSTWNESRANTLYAPYGIISGNSTWNESRANALYYGISNPSGFFNVSSYQSYNSTYHNYPVIWNSSILQYLNSGTNASYLSTYNSTYAALVTDNSTWNESRANTLYASIGISGSFFWLNSSSQIYLSSSAPNYVNISNSLFIDGTNSYVGIGTSIPGEKLQVNGRINATDICISGGMCLSQAGMSNGSVSGSGSQNYLAKFTGTSVLGSSLIYDDGTKIGIGTITPSQMLDVRGSGNFSGTVYINNGTDISTLSGNSTWNESRANTLYYGISNPSNFWNLTSNGFNKTYADTLYAPIGTVAGNSSFNQSLTDSLYAGIQWNYNQTTAAINLLNSTYGTNWYNHTLATYNNWNSIWSSTYNVTYAALVTDNSTWNESRANTLYYGISNPSGFFNASNYQSYNSTYHNYPVIWNSSILQYLNSGTNASYLSTYNVTYAALVTDNSTWNESRANTLYYGISNPSGFFNASNYQSYNSTYHNYPVIWNSSILQYLNSGTNASYLSTYNVTYAALVTDNSTWNESRANTLYYGISNPSNFWNLTSNGFNKTYADTLYSPIGFSGNPFNQILNITSNVTFNNLTLTGNFSSANFRTDGLNVSIGYSAGNNIGGGNTGNWVTSIGSGAGNLNTGNYSTLVGYGAAAANDGNRVTSVGAYSGTGNIGNYSTTIGFASGYFNSENGLTSVGHESADYNYGINVTALGNYAGYFNNGSYITTVGSESGVDNIGNYSTLIGFRSGYKNTADFLTALGSYAGYANTGLESSVLGYHSGYQNLGNYITALGYSAGDSNGVDYLTSVGYYAGDHNIGTYSTAIGSYAGQYNRGHYFTSLGYNAGYFNNGSASTDLGYSAGYLNIGDNIIGVGYRALYGNRGNNTIAIGYDAGLYNNLSNMFIVKQGSINTVPLIQGNFSSGNVGIGTATPNEKLTVAGNVNITSNNITSIKCLKFDDGSVIGPVGC